MTAFSRTWNASYESAPADSADASEGANRIRDTRTDVREREDVEHYMGVTDGVEQGTHKFPVGDIASRPTAASGRLYLNSETETIDFYDGAAWQVVGIPKATRMLFQQTAAPSGWTKDTTAALNDTILRIVTGAVTNRNGGILVAAAFAAAARSVSTVDPGDTNGTVVTINNTDLNLASAATNLGLSVGSHILTAAEIPTHKHLSNSRHGPSRADETYVSADGTIPAANGYYIGRVGTAGGTGNVNPFTSSIGSGSGHVHTLAGTSGSHSHTLSGSTGNHAHVAASHIHSMPTHTHTLGLDVDYHDVIIATKD